MNDTAAEMDDLDDYLVACAGEDPTFILHLRAAMWQEREQAVADAVTAERERCAEIVEAELAAMQENDRACRVADNILAPIRGGDDG